jgi:membrane-associated phospholipid phosphatase
VFKKLALIISVVFQPLLMPTLVFGLILFAVPQATTISDEIKYGLFFLLVLSTLFIPMITIIGLRLSGLVKSLHMKDRKDRILPFLITCVFFILTTYFFYNKNELDPILWQGMSIISVSVILLTLVTFFWKISAHMIGAGGLVAVVAVLGLKFSNFEVLYPLLVSVILSGVIGASRLYLNAHRPLEVYLGFLMGFLICGFGFAWIWA